jgi:hypothetical protein
MAPQTWTLSGCFGFPKTIGAESVSVMVGLILMGLDGAFIGEYNVIEGIVISDELLAELYTQWFVCMAYQLAIPRL